MAVPVVLIGAYVLMMHGVRIFINLFILFLEISKAALKKDSAVVVRVAGLCEVDWANPETSKPTNNIVCRIKLACLLQREEYTTMRSNIRCSSGDGQARVNTKPGVALKQEERWCEGRAFPPTSPGAIQHERQLSEYHVLL